MRMRSIVCLALICLLLSGVSGCMGEASEPPALRIDQFVQQMSDFIHSLTQEETTMSMKDILKYLAEIGIPISAKAQAQYDEMVLHMKLYGMQQKETTAFIVRWLLVLEGVGDYDHKTGVWTPTSSNVYSFDAEVYDIAAMYRLFLQGVASIVPGFDYTDAQETIEERERPEAPLLDGEHLQDVQAYLAQMMAAGSPPDEGTTTVSFRLNGHEYRKELAFRGDWFNEDAIVWVNEVLAKEDFSGRLYAFPDGGQGLILVYGDEEKNAALQALMDEPW